MFCHLMLDEKTRLNNQRNELQAKVNALPEGNLFCTQNGKYFKSYISNGLHPTYIPQKESNIARQLAARKYYELQLAELDNQLKQLEKILHTYKKENLQLQSKKDTIFHEGSPYQKLFNEYLKSDQSVISQWIDADYNRSKLHPEHLIHRTLAGHFVRSKSEVMIANALFQNQIPYRYECALTFDALTLYPDFTLLHPKTFATIYWEHFGMMDSPSYQSKTCNKLKIYTSNGLIPSLNLITTYETAQYPLDSTKVMKIIQEYFQ